MRRGNSLHGVAAGGGCPKSTQGHRVYKAVAGRVNQQLKMAEKIDSQNRKLYCSQQKRPSEGLAREGECELFLPPTVYRLTSCTRQGLTTRRCWR